MSPTLTNRSAQLVIYICSILILIAGLSSFGHLTWRECLRLFLIMSGILVLYFRYRKVLGSAVSKHDPRDEGIFYSAAVIVALTLIFVTTQFDPFFSGSGNRTSETWLSPFLVSTILLAGVMTASYLGSGRTARRNFSNLDWIVLWMIVVVILISLLSNQFLGGGITSTDLVSNTKILSYLLVWFPVTRVLSDSEWAADSVLSRSGLRLVSDRWKGLLAGVMVLFVSALIFGVYRAGAVIYRYDVSQRLYESGDLESAKAHYAILRKMNKSIDMGWMRDRYLSDLAAILLKDGDQASAQAAIAEMQNATVDPSDAHRKAGEVYGRAQRWDLAASSFGRSLKEVKGVGSNTGLVARLGTAYMNLRDPGCFQRLIEEHKQVPDVEASTYGDHIFLGNIHLSRQDYSAARHHFGASVELKSLDSYAIYKIGRTYLEEGRYEKAEERFEYAVEIDPEFADAYYWLGVSLERLGKEKRSAKMYRRAVEILPSHLDGLVALQRMRPGKQLNSDNPRIEKR